MASNQASRDATAKVMADPEYQRLLAAYEKTSGKNGTPQPEGTWQEIAAKISARALELTGIVGDGSGNYVINPHTGEITTDTKWKNFDRGANVARNVLMSYVGGKALDKAVGVSDTPGGSAGSNTTRKIVNDVAIPAVTSYIKNAASDGSGSPSASSAPGQTSGTTDFSDPKKALNYFGNENQNRINDVRNETRNRTQGLENRFNVAADRATADYDNLQGQYKSFMNSSPITYNPSHQDFGAYSGYQNFADTGGYSDQDKQNIRARANAPIKATYQNAQNNLSRQNVLAGGNLANAGAAQAKMSRELSYSLGDQSLNTEASLAEAVRNGKLAGLGGMTGIDTSRMSEGLANASGNLQAQGMESNRQLGGLQGQTSLYGATPGQANLYGNQMLNSSGQGLQVESLQNQLMNGILQGSLSNSALPSGYQKGLGNTASTLSLIGQIASIYNAYKGGGSSKPSSGAGDPSLPGGTTGHF